VAAIEHAVPPLRVAVLTSFALCGFAANSLLCRYALDGTRIDAASFTAIRLVAGAITLWALHALKSRGAPAVSQPDHGWRPAILLFVYAIAFSFAYLSLEAGTGALILFGMVQVTMLFADWRRGTRLRHLQWLGVAIALAGLAWLVSPGLSAPSPTGAVLMAIAGMAWGLYSLMGRRATDPVGTTARNFARAVPFALVACLPVLLHLHASFSGVVLAAVSGSIASGLGYVAWYAALPGLTTARAATVQLGVPLLAAIAAIALLDEPLTARIVTGGLAILGGIALALLPQRRLTEP